MLLKYPYGRGVQKTEGAMHRNGVPVFGPNRLEVGRKIIVCSGTLRHDWEVVVAEDRRILLRRRSMPERGKG